MGGWFVVVFSGGGSAADGGPDGGERRVGVLAEGRDGADAHDDDQGEHDGVLDRGRAVFRLQELHDTLGELTHGSVSGFGSGSRSRSRWVVRSGGFLWRRLSCRRRSRRW